MTNKGNTPKEDVLWDKTYPYPISSSSKITYRLQFDNPDGAGTTIAGKDFYDKLPLAISVMNWASVNNISVEYAVSQNNSDGEKIKITYQGSEIASGTKGADFSVGTANPEGGSVNQAQCYITWAENDFNIEFPATVSGSAYIYVTFDFAKLGDNWSSYANTYRGKMLENVMVMYGIQSMVTHTLGTQDEGMLQKGVYETGYYTINSATGKTQYFRNSNRFNYVKNTSTSSLPVVKNTVTYVVTIKNNSTDSNSRLYLSSVYDVLPKGFEYYSLVNTPEADQDAWGASGSVHLNSNGRAEGEGKIEVTVKDGTRTLMATITGGNGSNALVNGSSKVYMKDASKKTADDRQIVKFDIELAGSNNKDDVGYYLNCGEYVVISYMCFTGNADVSMADNYCAMEYIDTGLNGVTLDETSQMVVDDYNGQSPNNGIAKLWDDEKADIYGFTEKSNINPAGANNTRLWFASSVNLTEGKIVPGITKAPASYSVRVDAPVEWNITVTNNGTNAMSDYIVTDTMELPFNFTGKVYYTVNSYNANVIHFNNTATNLLKTNVLSANSYLFEITGVDEDGVSVKTNTGATAKILFNAAEAQTLKVKIKHGDSAITTESNINLSFNKDSSSVIMNINFLGADWAIPANAFGTLNVSTILPNNVTVSAKEDIYTNKAKITPSQNWDDISVTQGIVEGEGTNKGVVESAPVSIYSGVQSASYKEIRVNDGGTDKYGVSSNYQNKGDNKDYVVLSDRSSTIEYTLNVSSDDSLMKELVVIDSLPQFGDCSPINDDYSRNSQFKINFSNKPNVTVGFLTNKGTEDESIVYLTRGSDFTLQYSTASRGFSKNYDWTATVGTALGTDYQEWHNDLDTGSDRSIRIHITTDVPTGTQVVVKFNAVIDTSATGDNAVAPGEFAWNSFAYDFKAESGMWLYAAPLNVGVGIPGMPSITKQLVNSDNNAVKAEDTAGEDFEFIIFLDANNDIDFGGNYSRENVAQKIGEKYYKYTYLKANVPKNSLASNKYVLDSLKSDALWQYSYSNGEFVKLNTNNNNFKWIWSSGTEYTVVELDPIDDEYSFGYINDTFNTDREYKFTYDASKNEDIVFANKRHEWSAELIKTDDDTNQPLAGAVFGLYTTNKDKAISAGELQHAKSTYILLDVDTAYIDENNVTHYLMAIQVTDIYGKIIWSGLSEDEYTAREIKPPNGYNTSTQELLYKYSDARTAENSSYTKSLGITNTSGVILPETGGNGFGLIRLVGAVLTVAAVLVFMKRRFILNKY